MRRFCNLGISRFGGGARRPAVNGLLGNEACATSGALYRACPEKPVFQNDQTLTDLS